MIEKAKEWVGSSKLPAGFATFPKDLPNPPREWAQRFFDVQRWTEVPKGGHFAAMEEPELLAEDSCVFPPSQALWLAGSKHEGGGWERSPR